MDKVYFQKLIYSGTTVTKGTVRETGADFSVFLSKVPFIMEAEAKDPPKRDWPDEDGLDILYDNPNPPLKDYELELECMSKADNLATLRANVNAFLSYLRGDDGKGNVFAVYDTHCKAGRRNVRFQKAEEDAYYNCENDGELLLTFKIKLHVDDPRTEVSLSTTTGSDGTITVKELTYTAS